MIVPRSSQMITQDNDYCLFNVTLFKKVVEEFKLHARERKFIVRDFVYNEEELAAGKNEMTKLITDKKKQFVSIVYIHKHMCITVIIHKNIYIYIYSFIHLFIHFVGSIGQMVEGELQRSFLCFGACESAARLCRIRFEVSSIYV